MSTRGYKKTAANQERLRKDAEVRQQEYDALTLQQKLDKLPAAPQAAKQRAKLMAQTGGKSKPLTRPAAVAILAPAIEPAKETLVIAPQETQ